MLTITATINDALTDLPATVTNITIDTWEHHDGYKGIIWDRTGLEADNGEWGQEVGHFTVDDHSDITCALRDGWNAGDWEHYVIDGEWGDVITAVRA